MGRADESKRRLLEAATAEFAAHGIAGARVDRIVEAAQVNKAQMYAWYTSKDKLFDAVLDLHILEIVNAVPLDADDLPGYAARLYDAHLARPLLTRLAAWARLERVPTGDLFGHLRDHNEARLESVRAAQASGRIVPDVAPEDVLAMITATAQAWSPISLETAATPDEEPAVHERRKRALAETVRRALVPARAV